MRSRRPGNDAGLTLRMSPYVSAPYVSSEIREEVVANAELGDRVQEVPRIHGAGGVRRAVDEDCPGAWRHGGPHVLGVGQVAALGIGRNEDRLAAGERDLSLEVRVARVGDEHLVPRIDPDQEREQQRLHGADRHEDLRGRVNPVAIDVLDLLRDGLAEIEVPLVRRVLGEAVAERLAGSLDDVRRGREARLAHRQADGPGHAGRHVEHAADERRRHRPRPGAHPVGRGPHQALLGAGTGQAAAMTAISTE